MKYVRRHKRSSSSEIDGGNLYFEIHKDILIHTRGFDPFQSTTQNQMLNMYIEKQQVTNAEMVDDVVCL